MLKALKERHVRLHIEVQIISTALISMAGNITQDLIRAMQNAATNC